MVPFAFHPTQIGRGPLDVLSDTKIDLIFRPGLVLQTVQLLKPILDLGLAGRETGRRLRKGPGP
jgi:hypothetical protein